MYLVINPAVLLALCLVFLILLAIKRFNKQPSPYAKLPTIGRQFLWGNAMHFALNKSPNKEVPKLVYNLQTMEGFGHLMRTEGMCFIRLGVSKILLLNRADTIRSLLSSTTELDKGGAYKLGEPIIGQGLLTCNTERWKKTKKIVSPAFSIKILEDFLPIMNDCSQTFVSKIREKVGPEPFDIVPPSILCTFDIILETAMGTRLDVQNKPDAKLLRAVRSAMDTWVERSFKITLKSDMIFNMLPIGRKFYKDIKYLDDHCKEVIRMKREANSKMDVNDNYLKTRKDSLTESSPKREVFLDILLKHQEVNKDYTDYEMIKECLTFMGAGHDTTSYTISWSLFLFGLYPEIQEKVYQEIRKVLGDDKTSPITPEDLKNLVYLECAIKETLRLYPSVPFISRKLRNELKIGDKVVPRNTNCFVLISSLHRDPKVFPNPEIYDPDRFLPENSSNISQYAYAPFAVGSRACMGKRFALMESKILLADLLRNFVVKSIDQRDKYVIVPQVVGKPHKPIMVTFTERVTSM